MENLGDAYAPAIALEGWNYIRYLGPFTTPQAEPVFLCVNQGKAVVATGREPSKLWYVNRLRAVEDDAVNRHACSFKREGTQTYINYHFSSTDGSGEIGLGPQARFDVLRVTRMRKPSHIRVYQIPPPSEECCSGSSGTADGTGTGNAAAGTSAAANEEQAVAPAMEWYLGISSDLTVVLRQFPPESECSSEMAGRRPVWELTTREEAIEQDYPTTAVPTWDPRRANNPMRKEYYMQPDRFKTYDRDFWPSSQRPT